MRDGNGGGETERGKAGGRCGRERWEGVRRAEFFYLTLINTRGSVSPGYLGSSAEPLALGSRARDWESKRSGSVIPVSSYLPLRLS